MSIEINLSEIIHIFRKDPQREVIRRKGEVIFSFWFIEDPEILWVKISTHSDPISVFGPEHKIILSVIHGDRVVVEKEVFIYKIGDKWSTLDSAIFLSDLPSLEDITLEVSSPQARSL